jgi:hypothetical protein
VDMLSFSFMGTSSSFFLSVYGWVVPYPREERSFDDSTLANRVKAGGELFLIRFILGVSPEPIPCRLCKKVEGVRYAFAQSCQTRPFTRENSLTLAVTSVS